MARMSPLERREAIVDAALSVARRKGLASTTVRDVAGEMGTSSGLIHHYFETMDDVLAAAFERVAREDLEETAAMLAGGGPAEVMRGFLRSYAPVGDDWAFQLWLDAWAEAGRRPVLREVSSRLNLAWAALLERAISGGVADGSFRCADPQGAAWRILSLVDGLALQVVAHRTLLDRADMLAWAATAAERELGLQPGDLAVT